jgi:hypothetical protein
LKSSRSRHWGDFLGVDKSRTLPKLTLAKLFLAASFSKFAPSKKSIHEIPCRN